MNLPSPGVIGDRSFPVCLDLRVQLWNFHDEDIQKPSFSFAGHRVSVP